MKYAYDEQKMLEAIAAFRAVAAFKGAKPGRPRRIGGCKVHGNSYMRPTYRGSRTCRVCLAAHARKHYRKNAEKIKAHKKDYYQLRKAA